MIENWKDIIPKGTDPQVQKMIPFICYYLPLHASKGNEKKAYKILEALKEEGLHPVKKNGEPMNTINAQAYIGKAIQVIRKYHLLRGVASSSKGYYMASEPNDYMLFIVSMYERSKSAMMIEDAAKDDMLELFPDFIMPEYTDVDHEEYEDDDE